MNSTGSKPIPTADEREVDLRELRAFVGAAPDHPSGWVRLASQLESSGLTAEALEAWQKAGQLVPDSLIIRNAISRLAVDSHESSEKTGPTEEADSIPVETEPAPADAEEHREQLDLDKLITDLQSGRREPTLDFAESEETSEPAGNQDVVVSETLAAIYESQNHFAEAATVYETLADRETIDDRADIFRAKAADIRQRIAKR